MPVFPRTLRPYSEPSPDPAMPTADPSRLDVRALEEELAKRIGAAPDFSRVSEAAKSRAGAAQNDLVGGLALSALGGRDLAPSGAAIFRQALKSGEPMDIRAGGVGYADAGGNIVENPVAMRDRDVKVIQSRIDARVREEERKAAVAIAQGRSEDARVARENAEQLKIMQLGIMQQNAGAAADARAERLARQDRERQDRLDRIAEGKPLLQGEADKLAKMQQQSDMLGALNKSYKDEYSQTFGVLGKAKMAAAREAGGMTPDKWTEMSNWYAEYKRQIEQPLRHATFGATLTGNEKSDWAATEITPGMKPETIRSRMTRQKEILDKEIQKRAGSSRVKGNVAREQIEAMGIPGAGAAPAPNVGASPAPAPVEGVGGGGWGIVR